MSDHLTHESRARVAVFLPNALAKALSSYHGFMEGTIPTDSKGFAAYHSAAKVAIAHVELLMKLAKWAEISSEKTQEDDSVLEMITKAEREVKGYKAQQNKLEQEGDKDDGI